MQNSRKGINYLNLKCNFGLENYLLLDKNIYTPILKFRTSNHKLPVETGRWRSIDFKNRICPLCNMSDPGDEYHYIFICPTIYLSD